MSTRRSGRSRSQSRSRRDEGEAGSEPESAPSPSPAELEEEEFEESQQADGRVLERAEELLKIKEQQRQTGEGLAALRQRFGGDEQQKLKERWSMWARRSGLTYPALPWVVILVVSMIYRVFVLRTKNKQVP